MNISWQLWFLVLFGVSCVGVDRVSVSVMEGDPVTLNTDVTANQHETIKWYFNDIRVFEINKDQIKICTDDDCEKMFGNRLKLDNQTGSLTITNTRATDSGDYYLYIINSGSDTEHIFNLTVRGVSAPKDEAKMKRNPVKEGESGSGLSSAAVAGICAAAAAAVFVLLFIGGVIYYHKLRQARQNGTEPRTQNINQDNGPTHVSVDQAVSGSPSAANGMLLEGHESAATSETSV